jgi:transglutaminase-like putative cysteine protease
VGADASHAWLSVWTGDAGWIDVDPTNDQIAGDQHVTLAWGRDYADVAPIKGVILGGGGHTVEVAVDVEPIPEPDAPPP